MSDLKQTLKEPVKQGETPPRLTGKARPSIKRRIMQRVLVALLFSGGVIAAQEMGWLDSISRQLTKQKINWLNNQEVTKYLRQVIADQKLSETSSKCLVFITNNDTGGEIVDMQVREQHNNICTDTRSDFPLLFTFRINRTNGNVQVDRGSPNHFYPIH